VPSSLPGTFSCFFLRFSFFSLALSRLRKTENPPIFLYTGKPYVVLYQQVQNLSTNDMKNLALLYGENGVPDLFSRGLFFGLEVQKWLKKRNLALLLSPQI
jgi:hypothetical protein